MRFLKLVPVVAIALALSATACSKQGAEEGNEMTPADTAMTTPPPAAPSETMEDTTSMGGDSMMMEDTTSQM